MIPVAKKQVSSPSQMNEGRPMPIIYEASRYDLLVKCQQVGIQLAYDYSPSQLRCARYRDPKVGYEAFPLDLDAVFAVRYAIAPRLKHPWGGDWTAQHEWGRGTICTVQQTLQALIDYFVTHGHLPNRSNEWVLRCSEMVDSRNSFYVGYGPGRHGLCIGIVGDGYSARHLGALSPNGPYLML